MLDNFPTDEDVCVYRKDVAKTIEDLVSSEEISRKMKSKRAFIHTIKKRVEICGT